MDGWDGIERRGGEDRRRRRVYRFIDRRQGWDRRRRYPVLGVLRGSPMALLLLLAVLNLFSLLDAGLTLVELRGGIAAEGNPVMAHLFAEQPYWAIPFKVGVILLVSLGIWHGRGRRDILALGVLAALAYVGVVAYHLWALWPFVVLLARAG